MGLGELRGSRNPLARALSQKGTVGCLLCRSAVARQLAALKQGERATAGSDLGTHSRQSCFHVKAEAENSQSLIRYSR